MMFICGRAGAEEKRLRASMRLDRSWWPVGLADRCEALCPPLPRRPLGVGGTCGTAMGSSAQGHGDTGQEDVREAWHDGCIAGRDWTKVCRGL
jgi:hypothetical protein